MSFPLHARTSPGLADLNSGGSDDHGFPPNSSSTSSHLDHDMHKEAKEKDRPHLEIILDSEYIALKGTGPDVAPAVLSGHVALFLSESTSIKEVTLQFRGKARLSSPGHDAAINGHTVTYVVCSHEWSFLEGSVRSSHTLKAGHHCFPFQLHLGGSLPSSIAVLGGASVTYKLKAHVTRTGFAHNLDCTVPVHIVRSFAAEALEYQQTLEIENTWPKKLMYSIMIPHKAWAVGDTLTALVKLAPLSKGVRIASVQSTINETVKIYGRSGSDQTRTIGTVKHEFDGDRVVQVPPFPSSNTTPASTPGLQAGPHNHSPPECAPSSERNSPVLDTIPSNDFSSPSASAPTSASSHHFSTSNSAQPEDPAPQSNDIVSKIDVKLPHSLTPTHPLEPVTVTHRIRWIILIQNPDGHTSELRCSLPLHILDHRLLGEALSLSAATRRLLLGGPEDSHADEDRVELPSYTAHIRDRVANMYLPDAGVMRVSNPWIVYGVSPTLRRGTADSSRTQSGAASPMEARPFGSHLNLDPGSTDNRSLDWVNSELLLSLRENQSQLPTNSAHPPESHNNSDPLSRVGSRPASRPGSRAQSPDRSSNAGSRHPATPNSKETYVHSSQANRTHHGLFHVSMKPLASLTHSSWLPRSNSHSTLQTINQGVESTQQSSSRTIPVINRDPNHLHNAFTMVPSYSIASRGFIGGVPPLSSMRGLPSYEEVERSHAEVEHLSSSFSRLDSSRTSQSMPATPLATDF